MKLGKNLKTLRKAKKMTLKEISKKSGVQIATLSRMENNIMTGTLESHINICKALGVSLSDFYRELESGDKIVSLSKQKERHRPFVRYKKSIAEILVTKTEEKRMVPLLIKVQKGARTHGEKNKIGTEKFIYMLEGKIRLNIGKEVYNLSKGDSIYFDASFSHIFYNNKKKEARLLSISSCPVRHLS